MKASEHVKGLLDNLGEDSTREGLLETPKRVVKYLQEFLTVPEFEITTFDAEGYSQMIALNNIYFYSICEHHMLPFFGTATIGYIPNKKIVGLSKLPRILEKYARRLQNQERITMQVSDDIEYALNPIGVGVMLKARHLCMEMRGVKKPGVYTVTSSLKGKIMEDQKVREEFLFLAEARNGK